MVPGTWSFPEKDDPSSKCWIYWIMCHREWLTVHLGTCHQAGHLEGKSSMCAQRKEMGRAFSCSAELDKIALLWNVDWLAWDMKGMILKSSDAALVFVPLFLSLPKPWHMRLSAVDQTGSSSRVGTLAYEVNNTGPCAWPTFDEWMNVWLDHSEV